MQKPPFPGVSECKYRIRTHDRALTITVFTDIGAVGTVIFLCLKIGALGGDKTEIIRESKGEVPLSQILSRARREKINSPSVVREVCIEE